MHWHTNVAMQKRARRRGAARDAVRVGALAPMRRCVNACGENVCTCTHDEGGACRLSLVLVLVLFLLLA